MMITDKRIEKLQLLSNELCSKYEIFPLIVKRMTTFVGNPAQFNEFDWAIEFDPIFDFKESEFEEIIWHEFRHAWQLLNYEDIYRWWLFPSKKEISTILNFTENQLTPLKKMLESLALLEEKRMELLFWKNLRQKF